MAHVRKSKSHSEADDKARKADPVGYEERKEEFVQRMVTEGLAKLEDKLRTRHGKKVFRDEVKFQKNLHKEAMALKTKMIQEHRHELRLIETAVVANGSIDWKTFVSAARPLRKKVGGRGIQVMWWAMNTAERTEVQVTDLRKWLKGKSRLNNELAIRLRAKLAMFSDLIQQIREKARLVYRDGDARFKTYSLEKLMEDYSNMADNCAATLHASPAKASASDKEANKATKRELTKSTNLLTVKVHVTGKHMAHVYDQTFDLQSKQPWFLRQNRGTSAIGEPLTVQIGARSFLAYVPDGDDNRVFDIEIPAWMRTYLADQEANDFLASTRARRNSLHAPKLGSRKHTNHNNEAADGSSNRAGHSVKSNNGFADSMLDVILGTPSSSPDASPGKLANEVKVFEGNLLKQGAKFGLWHPRYFRLHVHFLAYWHSKSAYIRGVKSARNTPSHHVSSPGDEWKPPSNLAQQLGSEGPTRHSNITELQASHDATAAPEACFDLHLLQSAVVERQDIVLTFTAIGNGSVVRRLRAPSHANALAWQEAIYQHYTWYCTNRETELLAFMNTAQHKSRQRKNADDGRGALARETFDGIARPRSNSSDCLLKAIVKSRREVHRKHDLAARVKDTPRSHGRRMKSSMTTREAAQQWRRQRKDQETAVAAATAMAALARTQTHPSSGSSSQVRPGDRPALFNAPSSEQPPPDVSDSDSDDEQPVLPPPASNEETSVQHRSVDKLGVCPLDTALRTAKKQQNEPKQNVPSTPPPAFSPATKTRVIMAAPTAYGDGYSPRGSADSPHGQYAMSPHKRVMAGLRRPGWARTRYPQLEQQLELGGESDEEQGSGEDSSWMPPPPPFSDDLLDSPRSPRKGRVPMSPLQQRGPSKHARFAKTNDDVPKSKYGKHVCKHNNENVAVAIPPPPSVPHPKHKHYRPATNASSSDTAAAAPTTPPRLSPLVDADAVSPASRGKWSARRHSVRVIF